MPALVMFVGIVFLLIVAFILNALFGRLNELRDEVSLLRRDLSQRPRS